MPAVKEADPAATPDSLDDAFATAMGAPARPREAAAPPELDPDAPFGRDDNGQPNAPHGYTKDGKVRRSTAGRKPKDDKPRTGPEQASGTPGSAPAGSGPASPDGKHDYTGPLHETAQSAWFFLSALGKGGSAIPVVGKLIPEQKVSAQASLFRAHSGQLVGAMQLAAEHNARAARWAAALEAGDITWAMMVAFMTFPFVMQSAAIWKDNTAKAAAHPEKKIKPNNALAELGLPGVAELAAQNDAAVDQFMAAMAGQFAAAMGPADATPGPEEIARLQAELDLGSMNGHTPVSAG